MGAENNAPPGIGRRPSIAGEKIRKLFSPNLKFLTIDSKKPDSLRISPIRGIIETASARRMTFELVKVATVISMRSDKLRVRKPRVTEPAKMPMVKLFLDSNSMIIKDKTNIRNDIRWLLNDPSPLAVVTLITSSCPKYKNMAIT